MATAKPKVKTSKSKVVANYDEQLARMAAEIAKNESSALSGGSFIGLQGGQFSYKGATIPEESINVVILDNCFENAYYPGKFDASNPQPPTCYALGRVEDDMVPHELAVEPEHTECAGCPMNEWASADIGRGKACKNTRRLALISEEDLDNIEEAEIMYLKLPVTSVKNWAGYVDQLNRLRKKPPFAVVTTITIVKDANTQFKLQFSCECDITENEAIGEIITVRDDKLAEGLLFPYQPPQEEQAPARGGKKVASRKPAPKASKATKRGR